MLSTATLGYMFTCIAEQVKAIDRTHSIGSGVALGETAAHNAVKELYSHPDLTTDDGVQFIISWVNKFDTLLKVSSRVFK